MPFKCRLNDIKSVIIGECEEWSKEIFVRMWCAARAHYMRTEMDFCRDSADPLQRHCNSIAEALQLINQFIVGNKSTILLKL